MRLSRPGAERAVVVHVGGREAVCETEWEVHSIAAVGIVANAREAVALKVAAAPPVLHCAGRLVRRAPSAEDGGLDAAMETEAFMCGAEGACSGHSN